MSIRVGLTGAAERGADRLLWTVPAGVEFAAKLLVGLDHVVEANLCHLVHDGVEYVWAHVGADDPCFLLGVEPRFSIVVPMVVKDELGGKVRRDARFPKSVGPQLRVLGKNMAGSVVRLSRDDSGRFSRYVLTPTGTRATLDGFDADEWLETFLGKVFVEKNGLTVDGWLRGNGVPLDGSVRGNSRWKGGADGPGKDEVSW